MLLDLTNILNIYGAKIDVDAKFDLPKTDFLGETFVFTKSVDVKGNVYNNGKSLEFTAKVTGEIQTRCARCLCEILKPFEFELFETLQQDEDDFATDDCNDVILFTGRSIDITDIVLNNFLTNMPGKYLCKEDCLGVCTKCGANLNESTCKCDTGYVDPRLEVLSKLLDK